MGSEGDFKNKWTSIFTIIKNEKTSQIYNENQKFEIGKAVQIGEGTDGTIFATGVTVEQAIKAQEELKNKKILK